VRGCHSPGHRRQPSDCSLKPPTLMLLLKHGHGSATTSMQSKWDAQTTACFILKPPAPSQSVGLHTMQGGGHSPLGPHAQ
jgi:hypothetical protein